MIRTRAQRAATKNRAYDARHSANPGKVARVAAILPHWQRGLVHVQMLQVRALRRGEGLNLMDTRGLSDYLTQRQWKSVVNQVNAGLRSWAELTVSKLARPIYELGLDDAERRRLLTLSRRYEWWTDPTLAPMVTRLARTSHPLPNFAHVRTMLMDNPIAQVEGSKDSTFRWWVRISLPGGAKPVRVPLAGNPYMDDQPGTSAATPR